MRRSAFAFLILAALVSTSCSHSTQAADAKDSATEEATTRGAPPPVTLGDGKSIADVVAIALPSVVSVSSTRTAHVTSSRLPPDDPFLRRFFGFRFHGPQERQSQGLGSGVVVGKDIVLTNNHVVDGADEIKVTTQDDWELEATVVGKDPKSDLAVLRVEPGKAKLKPAHIGDSSKLRLGDVVLAIGNPFGVGQTVTMGIVSAKGRSGLGIVDYEGFIQTDAAINPGNSGGALVNARGELVGINTAILSRSGGSQGVGFAIPSNMAQPIVDSILKHGKVVRGWLGVAIQDLKPDLKEAMGVKAEQGVLVSDVEAGSPAEKAGFQRGDVITKLDGKKVQSTSDLRNRIAAAGPGKLTKLEVVRNDKALTFSIHLAELPNDGASASTTPSAGMPGSFDGLTVEPLSPEIKQRYHVADEVRHGVVIADVEQGSVAAFSGLRPGDVVLEVNRAKVDSVSEFETEWRKAKETHLLLINRQGSTLFLVIRK